jgi:ClpP class serine protease
MERRRIMQRTSILLILGDLARFVFWTILVALLLILLVQQGAGEPAVADKRLTLLREMQKERGSRVVTLIHRQETLSLLGIPLRTYIDIEDAEAILRVIRQTPADKPIDLILHTPGGLVLAASQIAHAIQKHPGKVTVFVPHYAMSGGTLIALAADEIVMDQNAVLGPVDPQIGFLPAASIVKAVEVKSPEDVEDRTLILADISTKALEQVGNLVTSLLEKHLPEQKAKEVSELITTGQFTHDFPINVERARVAGIPVSTAMPDSIYRLMDLYPQTGLGRPSVNYVPAEKSS